MQKKLTVFNNSTKFFITHTLLLHFKSHFWKTVIIYYSLKENIQVAILNNLCYML